MNLLTFFQTLTNAKSLQEVEAAVSAMEMSPGLAWTPVGKENNRGPIEITSDPARSMIERITNAIDAVLELEHKLHNGIPECKSPKEAAMAWLGVPVGGLSAMPAAKRRALAHRVEVTLDQGEGRDSRVLEIRDFGVGIRANAMPITILSLNEGNKLSKHYLSGAYGQGGSSTFSFSRCTLIASRTEAGTIGFTVVKYQDLPADEFKHGRYVYLANNDRSVLTCEMPAEQFPDGTQVRHFGFQLFNYPSPLGPSSLYGSMNTNLFDPVMPIWFDNRVNDYRRVIKGTRNALNGAVDEGDEQKKGPTLSHRIPQYTVSLGDFGHVGIEYWLLESPTEKNKYPSRSYINPAKPIILTLNGQNQAELTQLLVRKNAELPFLTQRLIVHVECDALSPLGKRQLFSSNREASRDVRVRALIEEEIVKALRSDDELKRLNAEARQQGMAQQDESAAQYMRREVARLLRIQGVDLGGAVGGAPGSGEREKPPTPHPHPRPVEPIPTVEPPTFVRFAGGDDDSFTFYPGQRRYLRIETDANSSYHNPGDSSKSHFNIVVGKGLVLRGSTPLSGGRMRAIVEGMSHASIGDADRIRIELRRIGLPVLAAERVYEIVKAPEAKPSNRQVTLPPFRAERVDGPNDPRWASLGWPDDVNQIAFEKQMDGGTLVVYYSTAFPKFATHRQSLESRDPKAAESFRKRYEIWLIVHALLQYQDEQTQESQGSDGTKSQNEGASEEQIALHERNERCRVAVLSSIFAAREITYEESRAFAAEASY